MTKLQITFVYASGNKLTADPINLCDDCGTPIPQDEVYCDDCGRANHEAQYGDMDNHYDDSIWY